MNRWTTLALLAALAALAGFAWLGPTTEPPQARRPPLPPPANIARPPAPAIKDAPEPAAPMLRTPAAPIAIELCGLGRLPLPGTNETADQFDQLPAPLGRLALQEQQERLQRALSTGNARQRVAAWLLRQPEAADAAAQAIWANGLLAEARAGGDALALRWASSACSYIDDTAGCQQSLAAERVRADPDNGLHRLASAPTWPEAWQHLTRAHHWHEHPGGLTATVQAALDTLQPPPAAYLRARIGRETLARDAAQVPEGLALLEAQCAARPADCGQVAEQMAASADSAALLQQAAALGRQAGWPDARIDALMAATQAFHAQLPRWVDEAAGALGCAAAEPALAHARAVAQHGEVRLPTASRP